MSAEADALRDVSSQPRYARFSRRLKAMLIDWIISMVLIFGAVFLAVSARDDNFSRALGIFAVIVLLLYEPVLVSFRGGTLGHSFTNLRVVDQRTGGNVSFLKACIRSVIKNLLGWYSFLVMMATRRNQAVHDFLTESTVQVRDLAKATPDQSIAERTDFQATNLPSRWRRLAVIGFYLLLMFAAYIGVLAGLTATGAVSARCINSNVCLFDERIVSLAVPLTLLAASALCIGLGWRGRLLGARRM